MPPMPPAPGVKRSDSESSLLDSKSSVHISVDRAPQSVNGNRSTEVEMDTINPIAESEMTHGLDDDRMTESELMGEELNALNFNEIVRQNPAAARMLSRRTTTTVHALERLYRTQIDGRLTEKELIKEKLHRSSIKIYQKTEKIQRLRHDIHVLGEDTKLKSEEIGSCCEELIDKMNSILAKEEQLDTMKAKISMVHDELRKTEEGRAKVDKIRADLASEWEARRLRIQDPLGPKSHHHLDKKKKKASDLLTVTDTGNYVVKIYCRRDNDSKDFLVPPGYSFGQLLTDCAMVWDFNEQDIIIEDRFCLVYPSEAIVTGEISVDVESAGNNFNANQVLLYVAEKAERDKEQIERILEKRRQIASDFEGFIGPSPQDEVDRLVRERIRVAKEMPFYILFLCAFLVTVFLKRSVFDSMVFNQTINGYFENQELPFNVSQTIKTFNQLSNSEDMYKWLEYTFAPCLYVNPPQTLSSPILVYNRLVGGFRIRNVRVSPSACSVVSAYDVFGSACYAPMSVFQAQDQAPYGDYQGGPRWFWSSYLKSGVPWFGPYGSYPSNGYKVDFNVGWSLDYVLQGINELKSGNFVDGETRIVVVEFLLFNPNFNIFGLTEAHFEYTPGGFMNPTMQIQTFRLDFYGNGTQDVILAVFQIIWIVGLLCVIFILKLEYSNILQTTGSGIEFFMNSWNIIDIIIFLFGIATITLEVLFQLSSERRNFNIASPTYVETASLANAYVIGTQVNAFPALLYVLRLFKYFNIVGRIEQLTKTIGKAIPDVLTFLIIFIIILIGYCIMAYLLFGSFVYKVSSLPGSLTTCLLMMLGGIDVYFEMYAGSPIFAPIFFVSFVIVVIFVLLNIFIAIINIAYKASHEGIVLPVSQDLGFMGKGCLEFFIGWTRSSNSFDDPIVAIKAQRKRLIAEEKARKAAELRAAKEAFAEQRRQAIAREEEKIAKANEKKLARSNKRDTDMDDEEIADDDEGSESGLVMKEIKNTT